MSDFVQNFVSVRLQVRFSQGKHGPVLFVDDLDAQTLCRDINQQLVLELFQGRMVIDGLLDPLLQYFQTGSLDPPQLFFDGFEVVDFLGRWLRGTVDLPFLLGQIFATSLQHAGAVAASRPASHGDLERRLEVIRDARKITFGGGAHQPHQEKESHHRSDEIGVSDFPCSAVRSAAGFLYSLDNNGP